MFCKAGKEATALQRYARSLEAQEAAVQADFSLLFPMYTVPLETLMQMKEVLPHEELKAKNVLVEFEQRMGKGAFVSHQWVDTAHPDPEGKQLRVLQDALKHAMSQREISLDAVTATVMPSAKGLAASELWSSPLFFWYDYFSCPQLEKTRSETNDLSKAIDSIPAYVSSCAFFFALCPVVENLSQTRLLTPASFPVTPCTLGLRASLRFVLPVTEWYSRHFAFGRHSSCLVTSFVWTYVPSLSRHSGFPLWAHPRGFLSGDL